MPTDVASITREHVESFMGDLRDRVTAATAAKHYRSLQQLWKWLLSDGEIQRSPMERMSPPRVPTAFADDMRHVVVKVHVLHAEPE
jgi:site-specific recombinase XerD